MKNKRELRMYGLVPYNISPIQQAIQFGHAVVEYSQSIRKSNKTTYLNKYNDWADNWKTFMILNGGTSNHSVNRYQPNEEFTGTMESHLLTLKNMGIPVAEFYEPDLNDMLSAIVFIVDEEVFNKEDYPDFEDWVISKYGELISSNPNDHKTMGKSSYQLAKMMRTSEAPGDKKIYQEWVSFVGGEKNVFLKEFLSPRNFKLA